MKIEFVTRKDFNLIDELAKQIGCEREKDILRFPITVGHGYVKLIDLEIGLKLVIQRHKLKEELIIKRNSSGARNGFITITFNTFDRPVVFLQNTVNGSGIDRSSIYITSTDIGMETVFPADKNIHSTIIVIQKGLLMNFLEAGDGNKLINVINSGDQSFWYDANMTPEIQSILLQMDDANGCQHFNNLFYRIKIQQLIYQLFVELLEKENRPHHTLKASDIENIYFVRDTIISSLNTPPLLITLARTICMSETKMKLLFKQIFGKSIYNFYQAARMEEALGLLKNLSVTETGFKLGFTNISHFGRLFKKYHNVTPKKFQNTLR